MKKIVISLFFTGLLLFCVYGAISYSSVRVDNPASLDIVSSGSGRPESVGLFATNSAGNGLISFNNSSDYYSVEQGGLAEGVLVVSNKLESGIDFTFDCDSDFFIFTDNYGYGYLDSYNISYISMSVDENCPAGEYWLTVFLNAEFPGGSARLKTDLLVEVFEPVDITDGKAGVEGEGDGTGAGTDAKGETGVGGDGDGIGVGDGTGAGTGEGTGNGTGDGTNAGEGDGNNGDGNNGDDNSRGDDNGAGSGDDGTGAGSGDDNPGDNSGDDGAGGGADFGGTDTGTEG